MNRSEFKLRMLSLKSYRELNPGKGYWDWRNSLPDNLKYTNDLEYDMRGAYESGAQPKLEDDGLYHLPSRDYRSGRILKSSTHPTYWKALEYDSKIGYKPYFIGNDTYTWNDEDGPFIPWLEVEAYKDGGIHIKPENRGKFTALKKRTGKSASWFKEHGTPSLKKMAVFALNAKKWKHANGGEIPPDNSPVHVNPITGKPLANGAILSVFDLEDAANFTPVGDALSVRDAYIAASNNDWLNLTLAGLGILPFVPRFGRQSIPKVNKDYFLKQFEEMEKRDAKRHQVVDDFYRQRNDVLESLIENEDAFRRSANSDRLYGTTYQQVYEDAIKAYSKDKGPYNDNLPQMAFDYKLSDSSIKGQVDPRLLDRITINPRYADIYELDDAFLRLNEGLLRHEMGHIVDEKAGKGLTNVLLGTGRLDDPAKIREMFPKSYRRLTTDVLNKGSEIKSYMNEFRDFLANKGEYNPNETLNGFRRKLDRYSDLFRTLRKIFDSYKSKRQFIKDYNTIPLLGTGALGVNYYFNNEEQTL